MEFSSDYNEINEKDLITLRRIEDSSTKLQEQGHYLEALECMERALVLRNHLFGPNSIEVKASRKSVGELCNLLAMKNLEKNDFNSAIALLRKATILTKQNPLNLAVTYNNLACYNRKQGKLRTALQFLQKALKIEERCGSDVKYPADTYLNICAVLSQLGRHQSALENAQSALILLHESAFKGNTDSFNIDKEKNVIRLDRIAVLAIAYYNIGVEQEFLKKDSCMRSYQKGSEVAQLYLGRDHLITIKLVKAHASAQSKYEPIMSTCNTEPNLSDRKERYNMKQTLRQLKRNLKIKHAR